jgi:cysteine desulfurase
MYANNEIGTIQPITKISEIIRNFREELGIRNRELKEENSKPKTQNPLSPLFHTDAVQAFQYLDCDVNKLGVDLMTLSAHKIYGPKGAGLLYVRSLDSRSNSLDSIITGGGQEFGIRSGTENVPAIVGFGRATEIAFGSREPESKRVGELKDYFWQALKKIYPPTEINGKIISALKSNRLEERAVLPNILNVYFPDYDSEYLLVKLDMAGVAVSSGAACSARASKPSHVLQAMGLPLNRIRRSIRFSFGKNTTKRELGTVLLILKDVLAQH